MRNSSIKKALAFVLTLTLVLGQIGFITPNADNADNQPVLVITGTGVRTELAFTLDQLKSMTEGKIIQDYSSVNRVGTKKLQAGEGIKLSYLLQLAGVSDSYGKITFCASDGFRREFTKEQMTTARFFYPNIFSGSDDNAKAAEMIIAYRSMAITSGSIDHKQLKDNEGNPPLQLMLGQSDLKDVNNSLYVSGLNKIIVGDPLPEAFKLSGNIAAVKSYTMADIKLMATGSEKYTYMTKGGEKTTACKGVFLRELLSELKLDGSGYNVQIDTTDAASYPVEPVPLKEMLDASKVYLLAYEVDGQPIVAGGKDSTPVRIYRKGSDSSAVIKNVTGLTITRTQTANTQKSLFKHISYDSAPYNIDSISSATLTIEGPGLADRQIVTVSQLESMDSGILKGVFQEKINNVLKNNTYEGITVEYLLKNTAKLKDNAGNVVFWDKNLQKIGEYDLNSIYKADTSGNKMMIAYGINDVPLVFNESDPGYAASKLNANGCLKLVLNKEQGVEAAFRTISRIQVNESNAKGIYEHSYGPYNKPEYLYDTVTITGAGIGKDIVYSLKDIETLANDAAENLGYEDLYSLQNSASYWNNHTLKGVKLYELLLRSGMSKELPDSTPVQIIAKDGYNAGPITLGDIRNTSKYGVYIKGMKEPVKTGLPVLLAYGADGYPFVPLNTDSGFVNGTDNNGGPMRITFGQKSLEDINGPVQIKYVSKIIIGEDTGYASHNKPPYSGLKDRTLSVKVNADGVSEPVKSAAFKLDDLERLTLDKKTSSQALLRNYYAVKKGSNFYNDFYQGINLWYLLKEKVGLPGVEGTVVFRSEGKDLVTIGIDELNRPNNNYSDYYNAVTGAVNLKPVLAYAKNGYPLVTGKTAEEGYIDNLDIKVNGQAIPVKNNNGPLTVILPQSSKRPDGLSIVKVDEIVINLAPDPCSHMKTPYSDFNKDITIRGTGVKKDVTLKVTDIEEMLDFITKDNYYVLNKKNIGETVEFKGIALYDLLRETASLQPNAEKVKVTAGDGYVKELSIEDIIKKDYINEKDSSKLLKVLVAYGKNSKPLVPSDKDMGYDANAKNNGGPLQLVMGQKEAGDKNASNFIKDIVQIEVIAGSMTSWKHESAMYQKYLDTTLFRVTGSEVEKPMDFTLRQLEALADGLVRDTYTSSQDVCQFEGVDLKYLISEVVKLKPGIEKPTKLTIYSGSKYSRNVDVNQVWTGVTNTRGMNKKIILGYAREGYPLVGKIGDAGYVSKNDGGPIKLIIEENISMWIKWADVLVVGEGGYEEPNVKKNGMEAVSE